MNVFRRLSTARLLALVASVVAIAAVAGAAAVGAFGGGGTPPPQKSLAQALHDAAAAPAPAGVTARVTFTNNLFPSGALAGRAGSALMSGASGRLWATNDGRGRIELQSDAGDVQIVWSPTLVTVYDASSNTVYELKPPQKQGSGTRQQHALPTVDQISSALSKLAQHANVSGASPTNVGGLPAYSVTVSPKQNGGLVGSGSLAFAANEGVPLEVAVTPKGSSTPALELKVDSISFGPVATSDVAIAPPAGAKVVDLGSAAGSHTGTKTAPVTGLAAVQAAVPFTLVAPDTLNGAARTEVRLVGKDSALVSYGTGLGSTLVFEGRHAVTLPSAAGALPKVQLGNGATATELGTPLGTVLTFKQNGITFVVAGSITTRDAEAAAKTLAS